MRLRRKRTVTRSRLLRSPAATTANGALLQQRSTANTSQSLYVGTVSLSRLIHMYAPRLRQPQRPSRSQPPSQPR